MNLDTYIFPDCTLTTGCFCFYEYNENTRNISEVIDNTNALMQVPVYLVIYGDKYTIPLLKEKRKQYNLYNKTVFIELEHKDIWTFQWLNKVKENRKKIWETRDSRTSTESHLITCNKFDFVLQTIKSNPFNTTKFGWIDSFLGKDTIRISENYRPNLIPYVLSKISDKFHIQVLNVCDKKYKLVGENDYDRKREYYSQYRWVVCGGFFTCGKNIGIPILERLKNMFVITTELGFGHGEEMLYLEVLDEYYNDIERSYGDYNQILDNFVGFTRNMHYIYYFIVQSYLKYGYYKEAANCCQWILNKYYNHNVYDIPELVIKIEQTYQYCKKNII